MKLKSNQSGMAHIILMTIVILVAIIGFVGYRVLQNKNTSATDTAITAPKKTTSNDTDVNGGATKFLTIKEWGVKFALTTDTADAYYDTKTDSTLDSMSLRSHSLDSETDCTNKAQSVASIFRVAKDATDDQTGKKYSDASDGQTIGDYYYFIQSSQYLCTQNTEKAVILQGVRNSFNTAGPTIVKS